MAKKDKKGVQEGNLYDKIFKENAEDIFIPLVEMYLGIKIRHFHPLKEKMQTTVEREMDFFYEVETYDNDKFLLHLEFQTEDDPEMLYRTGEYHGMAFRRKKMAIRHIVIFLGLGKPQMPSKLKENEIYTGFDLININEFDSNELLSSQVPHVILLAILANFPKAQTESVLRLLVRQLKSVCKSPSELSKYLKQLIILSRLRRIEDLTIKIAQEMPITYNVETDYLYLKGIERGVEKERQEKNFLFVKNLIQTTDFTDERIAALVNIDIDFVRKIRKSLSDK